MLFNGMHVRAVPGAGCGKMVHHTVTTAGRSPLRTMRRSVLDPKLHPAAPQNATPEFGENRQRIVDRQHGTAFE